MKRILSLDLARGFTVFFMPAIHVVMLYSTTEVHQSILGWVLRLIAEGIGAQVFMLIMGVSFTYSRNNDLKATCLKAFVLLIVAYLLNILKFIVPSLWGGLPPTLLAELNLPAGQVPVPLIFLADILHFAALALPVLSIIYRSKHYAVLSLLLILIILLVSPFVWDIQSGNAFINYLLLLAGGHPPQVYFPLFPWIIYPLAGLAIGYSLHRYQHATVFNMLALIGIVLIVVGLLIQPFGHQAEWPSFYRAGAGESLFHLGIVLSWLWIVFHAGSVLKESFVLRFFIKLSKQITTIYILQWVIICWMLPFAGYHTNWLLSSLCWIIGISAFSFCLPLNIKRTKDERK